MIERASPDKLEAAVAAVEEALVARGFELTVLKDLMLGITNTTLDKMRWGTLARQFPGATGALALMQLARAMYQGTWADVAKALTTVGMTVVTLPPDMTSLRSIPLIDAMVASLPEVLRTQLEALHQWVQQSDDALTPALDLRQLGPVLAVVALLWYVQQRLPSPSGQLSGLGRFIADLPRNWQRLVSLDRIGAGLFAPVNTCTELMSLQDALPSVRPKLSPEEKAKLAAQKWWEDRKHLPDFNAPAPVIDAQTSPLPAAAGTPELPFEAASAPGAPVRGGAIAQPPPAPDDVATSAGGRSVTSWWTWLTAGIGFLRGFDFQQVAPDEGIEMTNMGVPTTSPSASTPLVPTAASGGAASTGVLRRGPLNSASKLILGGTAAFGTLTLATWAYLRGSGQPVAAPPTPTDLAAGAIDAVVQDPNGIWHAGLDELLGLQGLNTVEETAPVHHRRVRRALFGADAPPSAPTPTDVPSAATQLGLDNAQLDAVRMDQPLQSQLQSMRLWAQVVAQEMGRLPDWDWIARLPESEQTLVALQWHTLRELKLQMAPLEHSAETLLGQALTAAGWTGEWSDIEAQLPSQPVAGVIAEDRLPLLQYCLVRRAASTPNAVPLPTFTRAGVPLDAPTQKRLQDFVNSDACRGLAADVRQRSEALRPLLNRALRARLVIDGIKAKSHHHENGELQRHGAGLLVKFLQGQPGVERSVLTYADRLPNGRTVSLTLPNYLVLRATDGDPRVLLYRADLSDVQFFSDDTSLRAFLDADRMRTGVVNNNGTANTLLAADIVNAADPTQRATVAELVKRWTERYYLHQQRKDDPNGWNPSTSFQLDFTPVGPMNNAERWAAALVSHSEGLARQAQARNALRWNPLGIAKVKADSVYQQQLASVVQSLYVHAHPEVLRNFGGVLAKHGVDVQASGFDPDQLKLTWNGVTMSLTAWAAHGWQTDGLRRPALSNVQPDFPPDLGLPPNVRYEVPEWPSASELDAIRITAYQPDADGKPVKNAALTAALEDHDLRRELCGWLETYANDNRLAETYVRYLRGIPGSRAGAQLGKALGDRIRTGLAWMVAVAGQDGTLNPDSHRGLVHALERLDPANGRASSLHVVTLDGVPIDGLWALHDGDEFRIFLSGENGSDDRVLDVAAFKTWLRESTSYARFPRHVLFRYHKKLAQAFAKKDTRDGIPVGFRSTGGPDAAGRTLIEGRISDVEEISLTPLEQMAEALRVAGSVSAALVCSLATGGLGAGLCAAASLALVADGIVQAIDHFERGDRNDGIASVGGSLLDAVDALQIGAIGKLMFRLGRAALHRLQEAAAALSQFKAQARAFDAGGRVNQAFAVSPAQIVDSPMFPQVLPGGATVYKQGGQDYLKVDGAFVQAGQDENGILRLRDPHNPRDVGPPVEYRDGHWRRMDALPPRAGGTTPVPVAKPSWVANIPEADVLSPASLEMLEATFGFAALSARPGADLLNVVSQLAMEERIRAIIKNPSTLGLPGDGTLVPRAWADSRRLGNGRAVQTYVDDDNNNQIFGPRIGAGPVGVMVRVDDRSALPGVEALVDASNLDTLRSSLDLTPDAGRDEIVATARKELAAVITANPKQSLLTWQNWRAARHDLPAAADNLVKHFRALTKTEAEEIVAGLGPDVTRQLEQWNFPQEVQTAVADALASRSERQQREAVVNGAFGTLGDVQQLAAQLQPALPNRRFSVHGEGTNGIALVIKADKPGDPEAKVVFPGNGAASVTDADGTPYDSWQQGVYQQVGEQERHALRSPADLRQGVLERMKEAPIGSTCRIGKKGTGRGKRNVADCGPSNGAEAARGVEVARSEVALSEQLGALLDQRHAEADAAYFELKQLEIEYKALSKREMEFKRGKNGAVFSAQDAARLRELSHKNFRSLIGHESMNFATFELEDVCYKGTEVKWPAWFPLKGTALSTTPRDWMGPEKFIPYPEPIRRVFVPVKDANGFPTMRGMFRTDYPAGADLRPAQGALSEPGEGSVKITFTDEDLQVKLDEWSSAKPLNALTDAEIKRVEGRHMSPALKKYMGEARLLPTNAKALVPGDYRMYQILSCSESKILGGVFKALGEAEPTLVPLLWGSSAARIDRLTGKLFIYSDMDPCNISCDPRLTEVIERLPDMNIRVFYRFKDPLARKEWITKGRIERLVEKNRADWERLYDNRPNPVLGDDLDAWMKAKAVEEMKKPDVVNWLERHLLEHPLALPAPRLWEPSVGL
ncbi:hypothetical protein [Stenotrophomonas sp. PS02289]|uniref:hypothetical protein n=1 Tax=Stenotrophomonas sp. PS02289 TaxID=2991422 RepID=UPI00249B4B7B|nr:hypothetical protein [Stenotrophomonas sp. PS02289]